MGKACSMRRRRASAYTDLLSKRDGNRPLWRPRQRPENNIKAIFIEI